MVLVCEGGRNEREGVDVAAVTGQDGNSLLGQNPVRGREEGRGEDVSVGVA